MATRPLRRPADVGTGSAMAGRKDYRSHSQMARGIMERFFAHVQLFRKWRGEAPLRTPPRQRHSPADEGVGSTMAGDVEDATCGIGHQGRLFDRGLFTRGGRHFHRTRRGGDRTDDTDKISGIRVISGCHFHPLRVRWRPRFSCSENGALGRCWTTTPDKVSQGHSSVGGYIVSGGFGVPVELRRDARKNCRVPPRYSASARFDICLAVMWDASAGPDICFAVV